jgi:hypothetical protein
MLTLLMNSHCTGPCPSRKIAATTLFRERNRALDVLPERWRRCLQSLCAASPRNGCLCVLVPSASVARRDRVLLLGGRAAATSSDIFRTNGCLGAAGHVAVSARLADRLAFTLRVR